MAGCGRKPARFADAGYQVTVLCPRGKGYAQNYELLEGVHVYRHPMPQEGNTPFGYLWEYGWALFWEFLYAWWIFLTAGISRHPGLQSA